MINETFTYLFIFSYQYNYNGYKVYMDRVQCLQRFVQSKGVCIHCMGSKLAV